MEGVPRIDYSHVKSNYTGITKALSDAAISSGEKFVIFDSPLRYAYNCCNYAPV